MKAAFVSTGAAAQHLGVSTSTVRRLIDSGDIDAVDVGGRWLFRVADLDAYLDACAENEDEEEFDDESDAEEADAEDADAEDSEDEDSEDDEDVGEASDDEYEDADDEDE